MAAVAQNRGDIAGITVYEWDASTQDGKYTVTDGQIPNDFRGIEPDGPFVGMRITSERLLRTGAYGEFPGKWGGSDGKA
jgi:hypothetical protein